MNIRDLILKVRAQVYRKPEDGGDGSGGGAAIIDAPAPVADVAPAASTEPAATNAPAEPQTMLEAMEAHWASQPRNERGQFANKAADGQQPAALNPDGSPVVDPANPNPADPKAQAQAKPGERPAEKPPVAVEEDLTQMPDGLTPKAQERFQKLANTNRELSQWRQEVEPQISYIQETFKTNNVTREQFDKAVDFIGAVNRGDVETAQKIIGEEFSALSLMVGRPLQSPDPLASFPDLRQKVDSLQITEDDALELARSRRNQNIEQQRAQQTQQATQQEEQQQLQFNAGLSAVDNFCKRMQSSDLDYAAIEGHLVPVIPKLIEGVHPSRWAAVVEQQYKLIKQVSGSSRQQAQGNPSQVLRSTGSASPAAVPKSAYEAMFNEPDPRNS